MAEPKARIRLGLSTKGTTYGELLDGLQRQLALFSNGQAHLGHMTSDRFIRRVCLQGGGKEYEAEHEIPAKPQSPLIGHGSKRGVAGALGRDDDAEQEVIDEAAARGRYVSDLIDRLAHVMATSPAGELRGRIALIELAEGVDTQPFRSFIYAKQESLFAFDEIQIPIRQHVVRTSVAASEPTEVIISLDLTRSRVFIFKALVHKAKGGEFTDGIASGGIHEFRGVDLLPWQRAVLEAARWLGFPVAAKVVETMSTCTLRYRPADVHEVHAWSVLVDGICAAMKAAVQKLGENQPVPAEDVGDSPEVRDLAEEVASDD